MDAVLVIGLIAAIAFLYAMVGHGGASGYLALMAVIGFSPLVMKPTALLLNLCVSSIATVQFARAGHFQWRMFWPFALTSVPMSFIGYGIGIEHDPRLYLQLLGVCLLIAAARMFGLFGQGAAGTKPAPIAIALTIGAGIGFVSGMLGIGGGILLSPLLLWCSWGNAKSAAAISAPFILVNSTAGLVRASQGAVFTGQETYVWVVAAVCGGLLGSWVGANKMIEPRLRQALGLVLVLASIKLFFP